MSYNTSIKDELARKLPSKRCCRLAEMSAIISFEGSIHLTREGGHLQIDCGHWGAARKTFSLLKLLYQPELEIIVEEKGAFGNSRTFSIVCPHMDSLPQILNELGITPGIDEISPRITKRACCTACYVRGAFLSAGAMTDPRDGFHLEFYSRGEGKLEHLKGLLERIGIAAKLSNRLPNRSLYLKDSAAIRQLLTIIGAHDSLLRLEDMRTVAELKSGVNRMVNCEQSNLHKSAAACVEQLRSIETIEETMGLDLLPTALRHIAELRREYPETPMGALAGFADPPLSKSAVNHRFRRLADIARGLID